MPKYLLTLLLGLLSTAAAAEGGGPQIQLAGSSTVFPFAKAVAEHFAANSGALRPEVLSIGTGAGIKAFCAGTGPTQPDVANASRRIRKSELEECAKNGVEEVVEIKIGYDGIVLANAKGGTRYTLDRRELFLALAKDVPDPEGKQTTVANPYRTWKQVNPALPDDKILVIGPSPGSGTRDTFMEVVMESGCKRMNLTWIAQIQKRGEDAFKKVCTTLREDGAYVDGGEDYGATARRLKGDPQALGIFGFSYLVANGGDLQGAAIDTIEPSALSIANRIYRMARPLFVYVAKGQVERKPALRQYLAELTSEPAWGDQGYLATQGLVPLPKDERQTIAAEAKELRELKL